jgi:hypothetical protein
MSDSITMTKERELEILQAATANVFTVASDEETERQCYTLAAKGFLRVAKTQNCLNGNAKVGDPNAVRAVPYFQITEAGKEHLSDAK